MDKNKVEDVGQEVSGSIKEAIGKITGDTKTQAEGAAEKAAGTAQETAGTTKDTIHKIAED